MAKAAKGSGSIRRRADGTWEARYTAGRNPTTGKPIVKSIYGKRQKDVREKLRAATAAIDAGTYIEPTKLTLAQWLDTWLAEYTPNIKPLTRSAYTNYIANHLKPCLGAIPLSSLSAPDIQRMYNQLAQGGGKLASRPRSVGSRETRKPLSPKSIKNIHGVLHKALQQAVEIGLLRYNPADACKLPTVPKPEIQPLDEEQIAAFLSAIQGDPFERVYLVDVFTGLRQGEILGLTWDCINFDTGEINVRHQLQREPKAGGRYYLASLKSGKSRRIVAPPSVLSVLRTQRREQAELRITAGPLWDETGGVYADSSCTRYNTDRLVFTNDLGGHLAAATVYAHFKRIAADLGIPSARFHDLRHSYAVAAIRSGDDIKTVQGNLGHATASFTLDVYGHVTDQMRRASADRMEQFIRDVKAK